MGHLRNWGTSKRVRLAAWLETFERAAAQELWQETGWIFADELGRKLNARTDQSHWKRLLADANVRGALARCAAHSRHRPPGAGHQPPRK